jgi:hypothetical protein
VHGRLYQLAHNLNPKRAALTGRPFSWSEIACAIVVASDVFEISQMFEHYAAARTKPLGSPVSRIAGLLLFLCILLRIFNSFFNTERAFWACFGVWGLLTAFEHLLKRKSEKPSAESSAVLPVSTEKPQLPIWWRVFGPLASFSLLTIFLGFWPLGGFGVLLWLISWFIYDFIESSRLGRPKLTTLSLQ